jgi:hypothetical protein
LSPSASLVRWLQLLMKLLPTIFLILSITSFSQSDTARYGEKIRKPIDYQSLANFDFENTLKKDYVLSLNKQSETGSLILSAELLCGVWQAEGLGNNWGGLPQTIVKPNKRVVFRRDSIFFYHNDTLTRATSYRLVPDSVSYRQTLLELSDSREIWQLIFYQVGEHVPWHGLATKPFLLFNKEPDCMCGCPEELYSQEVSSQAGNY